MALKTWVLIFDFDGVLADPCCLSQIVAAILATISDRFSLQSSLF